MESRTVLSALAPVLALVLALVPCSQSQTTDVTLRCDTPADVVFVMDASDSIMPTDWEKEKEFVGILIDSLVIEPHASHVGIIVFSTEIGQVVDLQPFKTRAQLKAIVPTLVQTSQGTDTARAIARLREMIQNQGRADAELIGVVITDGRSENVQATIQEAVNARQIDKIQMIAIGVGNETYEDELIEIARSDRHPEKYRLIVVEDFKAINLDAAVSELRSIVCKEVTTPTTPPLPVTTTSVSTTSTTTLFLPPISCPRPADVLFLLDGSYSIKDEDWVRGRVFVSTLINSLEVDIEAIHVGIIVYSSDIGDTVPLKPFLEKAELKAKASSLRQPPLGRTNTALGIRRLRSMFAEQGRPGVPHIGIVITDGKSGNVQQTMNEAYLAKTDSGIVMVVIGVGQDTLQAELEAMTTSPSMLFNVSNYNALLNIVQTLREQICIAIDSTPIPTTTVISPTVETTPSVPELCKECLVEGGVGFNSYPPDCTKYVVCYPVGSGYHAMVKQCPFGLFWHSRAVACVDSAYVSCPADPCTKQTENWGHTVGTQGCGEYWLCRNGSSVPNCCPAGYRYSSFVGCVQDSNCLDTCSLQWTLAGSGSCPYRPNPVDIFSYIELVPGSSHVIRPCLPGTAYVHSQCECTYEVPGLGCHPSIHYQFNGSFQDQSVHKHPARVHQVLLTDAGTAYFNGSSSIQWTTLPEDHFRNNFVLRIRYRLQPERQPQLQWNDHYKWGFQDWFANQPATKQNITFIERHLTDSEGQPLPSGQLTPTLEKIVLLPNRTVVHSPEVPTTQPFWPGSQPARTFVTRVELGGVGDISDTMVSGGVVFVPNSKGQILMMDSGDSPTATAQWQIINADGKVLQSGTGKVPQTLANNYSFQLRPQPTTRWFIMTSTGTVLMSGKGIIPPDVKNLYGGFTSGKLLKIDQIGNDLVGWALSKPDGSDATGGTDVIPSNIRQQLKLDDILRPEVARVSRWAILSSSGEILESGTGEIPTDVMNKYGRKTSGLVLRLADGAEPSWRMTRTDGTSLLEGSGRLPEGVSSFIQGALTVPTIMTTSTWSVVLPNGTHLNGKGDIPSNIKELFQQASNTEVANTAVQSRWYVTDSSGTVIDSGYGSVPQSKLERLKSMVGTKFVQQTPVMQGGRRWEMRDQNGSLLESGSGEPPVNVFRLAQGQLQGGISGLNGLSTNGDNTVNRLRHASNRGSSVHSPGNQGISSAASSVSGGGGGGGGGNSHVQRKWTITFPNGTERSGTGEVPSDLQALLSAQSDSGVLSERRWSVTLPDGTVRSGVGDIPADIQSLLNSQGEGGTAQTQRRWTVTMPDGSKRTGVGELPAEFAGLVNQMGNHSSKRTGDIPSGLQGRLSRQGAAGTAQTQRRWTVTMPDGSKRTGVGELPAELASLVNQMGNHGNGQSVKNRWAVTLPDGSERTGEGEMPSDLKALLSKSSAGSARRLRRSTTPDLYDLLGNCNERIPNEPPSFLLQVSDSDVRLTVRTTDSSGGKTITLPAIPGMNDVQIAYDGRSLTGLSNGIKRSLPLTGTILAKRAPVTVGQCGLRTQSFRGEIDEVSLFSCIP